MFYTNPFQLHHDMQWLQEYIWPIVV